MCIEFVLAFLEEHIIGMEKEISWAGKGTNSTCITTHMNLRTIIWSKIDTKATSSVIPEKARQ